MMRRLLVSVAVILLVASVAYAAAASLNVDGGVVQAGSGSVGQCDTDGVSVGYHVKYDNNVNDFVVDFVTVSGIASACAGKTVAVQLTKDGSAISGASGTATVQGSSVQVNLSTPAKAADVNDVHVAIY
ncbi:MAG: hypothetical protein C4316_03040 [Chloroflexota bacterium]